MALAKNGFKDVRVLERAPSADAYNPSKAFVYALFPAGKNALRHLGMNDVDHIGAPPQRPFDHNCSGMLLCVPRACRSGHVCPV